MITLPSDDGCGGRNSSSLRRLTPSGLSISTTGFLILPSRGSSPAVMSQRPAAP
ncbi:MAG: hypothetical protein LCH92_13815 [Proteobacteria bacterium]|nr:hypothetical protein [Pseudomonadota bacterium]